MTTIQDVLMVQVHGLQRRVRDSGVEVSFPAIDNLADLGAAMVRFREALDARLEVSRRGQSFDLQMSEIDSKMSMITTYENSVNASLGNSKAAARRVAVTRPLVISQKKVPALGDDKNRVADKSSKAQAYGQALRMLSSARNMSNIVPLVYGSVVPPQYRESDWEDKIGLANVPYDGRFCSHCGSRPCAAPNFTRCRVLFESAVLREHNHAHGDCCICRMLRCTVVASALCDSNMCDVACSEHDHDHGPCFMCYDISCSDTSNDRCLDRTCDVMAEFNE